MTVNPFIHPPTPPRFSSFDEVGHFCRRLLESISGIRKGKIECVTELTLTPNSATTTFTDSRLSVQSAVCFDPRTANAAAELYGGTMYVLTANRLTGVWTITNANNANADRTFQVAIIG
jgi:uncharacterized membrane protein